MFTSAISSLSEANAQAAAVEAQGVVSRGMSDANARFAELGAKDAISRGEKEATRIKKSARRLIGAQKTAAAASGIDPTVGSAASVQEDTAMLAAQDVLTVRNNAWREAWGLRAEAVNESARGAFAESAARASAKSTLASGGMQAITYGLRGAYYASEAYGSASKKPAPVKGKSNA